MSASWSAFWFVSWFVSWSASWLPSIGELEPDGSLMKLRERPQCVHLNINFGSFGVNVSQQINSSCLVSVAQDAEVFFRMASHIRQCLLNDLLLPGVGLRRSGDVGLHRERYLPQLCMSDLDVRLCALHLSLVAISNGKWNLNRAIDGVCANVAFIATEKIKVRYT